MRRYQRFAALAIAAGLVFFAACGDDGNTPSAGEEGENVKLRLGYFPNLTHAPALYGLAKGTFADALGDDVTLDTKTFNAGGDAVTAIFGDQLDATFIGPNPAVNSFQKSKGEATRIVSGATSGGAFLVTKPEITSKDQLKGKTIATPQLGNTQDVALRAWLKESGLSADQAGGGDVSIKPQENSQTLDTFKAGQIDAAWVPEPWASRLILEGGGKVLLDEATLWPDGEYATTVLLVRKKFLEEHPDVVKNLIKGNVDAIAGIQADAEDAKTTVNAALEELSGKSLADNVLDAAWENLSFTYNPLVPTIASSATAAKNVGLLESDEIDGIEDLTLLNEVLTAEGKGKV